MLGDPFGTIVEPVVQGMREAEVVLCAVTVVGAGVLRETWLGQRVTASDWLTWMAGTALSAIAVFAVALILGLPASARTAVLKRYLSMGRAFRAR